MKLSVKHKKAAEKHEDENAKEFGDESLIGYLDIKRGGAPEGYAEVETYPLNAPFSYASIVQSENTAEYLYIVDEVPLSREEKEAYERMKNILEYEHALSLLRAREDSPCRQICDYSGPTSHGPHSAYVRAMAVPTRLVEP